MKFAKKIFVGIVAVALLVSCFALSTSAETPTCPVDDFESLLEYRNLDTYLIEDYQNYEAGAFTFSAASSTLVDKPVFTFLMSDGAEEVVVADGENKMLSIKNSSTAPVGYKYLPEDGAELLPRIIMSFDFKSGDATVGASDVVLLATLSDYFEDVPLFSANLTGDTKSFTYAEYDSERVTYSVATADVAPKADTWYSVTVVFDTVNGAYSVSVESEDAEVFSFADEIAASAGIDSIRLYAENGKDETGVTYIDNFLAYDGSFVRNVCDPENALAEILLAIDAYAKDPRIDRFERLRVCDEYLVLYGEDEGASYVIPQNIEKYAEMKAVVDDVPAFRVRCYADVFIYYVDELVSTEGYYEKIEYRDTVVKEYYDMFVALSESEEKVPGMNDDFDSETSYEEAIANSIKIYNDVSAALVETRQYSENFAKQLDEAYDPATKDFSEMLAKYNLLSLTVSKIDLDYRYSDVKSDTKYPTLADAYAEYLALETRIKAIKDNVNKFVPAVLAMDTTEAESVSAESPYLTVNFEALYENYLIANSMYVSEGDTVHPSLDPATYTDGDLDLMSVISLYKEKKAIVEARIKECNDFVSIINGAKESTYYVTVVAEVEKAKLYLDTDKTNGALERYAGVADAIAAYYTILERVAKNESDSQAYIAAVNEIDLEAGYADLRAAVDAAVLLQEDGSITGIAGVEAANVKLATALSKVETLEGYSKTLISSVDALKDAKTLAERRSLIFIALSVKDGAEPSISGVNAAKSTLNAEIAEYNAEIAELNALFGDVVSDAAVVITSAVADAGVAGAAEAIDKLN